MVSYNVDEEVERNLEKWERMGTREFWRSIGMNEEYYRKRFKDQKHASVEKQYFIESEREELGILSKVKLLTVRFFRAKHPFYKGNKCPMCKINPTTRGEELTELSVFNHLYNENHNFVICKECGEKMMVKFSDDVLNFMHRNMARD